MNWKTLYMIAAAIAAFTLGADIYAEETVFLDGHPYSKTQTVLVLPEGALQPESLAEFPHLRWLDLRGRALSTEEYDAVTQAVPQCRIVWELAFQGQRIPCNTAALRLEHLTEAEIPPLEYLHRLKTVDARECRDYEALLALTARLPDCRIRYTVDLGGIRWDADAVSLTPGPCSPEEIGTSLSLLPAVRDVDLRSTGLSHRESAALAGTWPEIRFLWNAELGGREFPTDSEEIDLSGIALGGTEPVEALLPYLPNVKKIVMCDCGIPSPVMAELNDRYPDIRFVWRVKLGPLSARTDDTWFAPITHRQLIGGHDADELKYCTDMECIDLGHCWIRDCEWARGMKKLKYLVLADSYVQDLSPLSELKELVWLELFVTPVRDYSPLLGCTALEDLNLGYTNGDPAPIAKMTWLKNLWWGGAAGRAAGGILYRNLPDTHVTLYSGSSTGLGWRTLPHYYEMRDRIGMYYMSG